MSHLSYKKLTDSSNLDTHTLANIHYNNLNNELLAQMGENFLKTYYDFLIHDQKSFGTIAFFEQKVAGFCIASERKNIFLNLLFSKYFFKVLYFILIYLLKNISQTLGFFQLVYKVIFSTKIEEPSQNPSRNKAELIITIVDQKFRTREFVAKVKEDISYNLVISTIDDAKSRDLLEIEQTIDRENFKVYALMKKVGFKKYFSFDGMDTTRDKLKIELSQKEEDGKE